MTLNLYIARRFLWLFVRVFGGFFVMMMMIDIIEELRHFADPGITLAEALALALMNVPPDDLSGVAADLGADGHRVVCRPVAVVGTGGGAGGRAVWAELSGGPDC